MRKILLIILLIVLSGCSSLNNKIQGVWKLDSETYNLLIDITDDTIVYDGYFYLLDKRFNVSGKDYYKIIDSDTISITSSNGEKIESGAVLKIDINSEYMTISETDDSENLINSAILGDWIKQ